MNDKVFWPTSLGNRHIRLLPVTSDVSVFRCYGYSVRCTVSVFFSIASPIVAGVDFRCFWCCRAFFDKIKLEFADILEANKVDLKNVALTFQRLLQFPLRRALDYQKQLAAVANLYPAVSSASGVETRTVYTVCRKKKSKICRPF